VGKSAGEATSIRIAEQAMNYLWKKEKRSGMLYYLYISLALYDMGRKKLLNT
jgi:hypothetical protein